MIDVAPILAEVAGARCWSAQRGHGTFLTFDFGERVTSSTPIGSIHLWIYMARWTLHIGETTADWDSPWEAVESGLQRFVGSTLVEIRTDPVILVFRGETSLTIELEPTDDGRPDHELFMLFLPNNRVLSIYQTGAITLEDATSEP